jgi:hypothetical protein
MYSVESEQQALEQVAALPAEALIFYAELMTLLETAPWGGESYDRQRPDANMRTHGFGKHDQGLVQHRVDPSGVRPVFGHAPGGSPR